MTVITKRLGYGGSGVVDGVQVLITGGSFVDTINPSFIEAYDIDPDNTPATNSRSRMLHSDGTRSFSGSMSFDLNESSLELFTKSKLLSRRYLFDVGFNDGETDERRLYEDCYITSLTLNGVVGGLLNASISFISAAPAAIGTVPNNFIRDEDGADSSEPFGYWYSGGPINTTVKVKEWSFTMNQEVEPVFSNEDTTLPKYLKVGLIDFSLSVTTYSEVPDGYGNVINIATSAFTIVANDGGRRTSKEYSFGGTNELGSYRHEFVSAASAADGSSGVIITETL